MASPLASPWRAPFLSAAVGSAQIAFNSFFQPSKSGRPESFQFRAQSAQRSVICSVEAARALSTLQQQVSVYQSP
jgi:hypothetical protein